ncbi:hypothetical protein H310_02080 [Aphanomyces invadans]|uniref:Cilia- and flagella-associated protein 69 ARM repeats domain-containing protein n=1 Tax=Aphanomyces invadans TaxID=157072 RepID=A0A024UMR7_9STRA|nr:hypothetical protein H310_02080 [Aphanomyces invadans]ETW07604.1 hypothetical protein H310_02080 [Aphanomyces invadans]|eukprot:XP_008863697.1 hypothetical protein H310_02080 [Aphanomyces invadans]
MATVRNDTTGNALVMKAKPPAPTDGPVVEDTGSAKDFQKILDTFQDKQTTELYSRQVALLQVLLQKFPIGFKLQNLPDVEAILRIAYEKIAAGVDVLIEPVCSLVVHCSKPYLRIKSNEEFTSPQLLHNFVCLLGEFLVSFDPQIQVAAADTLRTFATGACLGHLPRQSANADEHSDDQRPLPRDYSQQLIERCGVAEAAAAALQRLLDDQQANDDHNRMDLLLFPIVDLVQEISSWGPNAQILTAHGSHHHILDILDQIDDLRDVFLPLCLDILWNVLEISAATTATIQSCSSRAVMLDALRTKNAIYAMGNLRSFQVLHKLLQRLLMNGYRKQDKELRNTTLMILDILASKSRNLPLFVESGLLATLLKYAEAADIAPPPSTSVAKASNFASSCDEDFEFKHMLWIVLADVAKGDLDAVRLISDSSFLHVLLLYVSPDQERSHDGQHFSPAQRQVLQVMALHVLSALVPRMPELFVELHGHVVLLEFVQTSRDEEASALALQLCHELVLTSPDMQTDVGSIGGVEVMITLFADASRACLVRRTAIAVCGAMCRDHNANQTRFRRADGVAVLSLHLHFEPAHAVSQDNLIVAVVGCIWSSVIGNAESELCLIQSEGVDNLLDLLEVCPAVMYSQVLGVLAELCENVKAVAYFQAWKSKSQCGATQLLLRMYADEEKRLGVQRPAPGFLKNIARPLATHELVLPPPSPSATGDKQPAVAFVRLKQALVHSKGARHMDPNRRLVAATAKVDLRSKIFAVLASVGFSCVPDDLSFEEQMTLAVAKEFPVFRVGEEWLNIKMALHAQNIRPIYADALLIEMKLEHVYSIVAQVRCSQQDIYAREESAKAKEEALFFAGVRHQKEQERQTTSKKVVAKSSMKAHLEAKKRKADMLRKSTVLDASSGDDRTDTSTTFVFTDPPPVFHDL